MKIIVIYILMFFSFINISHAGNANSLNKSWYLKGVSEEKTATNINSKLELLGEKIMEKESIILTDKVNDHYNKALSFYLKGAEEGSAISAWKAASLGPSGMAELLPDEKIKILILQAARGNVVEAQMSFVLDNCNAEYTECKDGQLAIFGIKKAIKNKSDIAANILGFLYEHGRLVDKNINMAISCYKLSSEFGSNEAQKNMVRLLNNKTYLQNNVCE